MEIYLIDKEKNKIKKTYTNVLKFDFNNIEYLNNRYRSKMYCNEEKEFFSNIKPDIVREDYEFRYN